MMLDSSCQNKKHASPKHYSNPIGIRKANYTGVGLEMLARGAYIYNNRHGHLQFTLTGSALHWRPPLWDNPSCRHRGSSSGCCPARAPAPPGWRAFACPATGSTWPALGSIARWRTWRRCETGSRRSRSFPSASCPSAPECRYPKARTPAAKCHIACT